MIIEWITSVFLVLGSFFVFLAGLGIYRFPDLFMRMHAATKASAFGDGLILLGVIVFFGSWWTLFIAVGIVWFIFLTNPVSAHLIGRSAYIMKVPLWEGTVLDEMKDRYNPITHDLTHSGQSRFDNSGKEG